MKYYVYRHIREDKNVPFYIGIGTKHKVKTSFRTYTSEYKRAFKFSLKGGKRNKIWNDIYQKTEVTVDIIFESDDYNEIQEKEIEFITLYGRINNNTGTLANLTNGGGGHTGYIVSEETKNKQSQNSYLRGKFGDEHHLSKRIYVYRVDGSFVNMFESVSMCSKNLHLDLGGIFQCIKGKILQHQGYIFYFEYRGETIDPLLNYGGGHDKKRRVVAKSLDGNIVKVYTTVTEAAKDVKTSTSNISRACRNRRSIIKGFRWRYYEEIFEKIVA